MREALWGCPVMLDIAAFFVLAVWLYLLAGRGGFWLARQRDDRPEPGEPAAWPAIVAVIPARDEAASIGQTVSSLLRQDYPGLEVILVDDGSQDGTAQVAAEAAAGRWARRASDGHRRPAAAAGLDRQIMGGEPGRGGGARARARISAADRRRHCLRRGRAQAAGGARRAAAHRADLGHGQAALRRAWPSGCSSRPSCSSSRCSTRSPG